MAFPKVGNLAPKFSLSDHEGNTVSLADFKGKSAVVVYFYPKAMTPGCTLQAQGLRDSAKALKGLNIGAAPWVDLGLRALLKEDGIDPDTDVNIAPIPGTVAPGVSFGVTAAAALEDGKIDAFWANGMGAEVAVTKGVGKIVLDPRRGVGPAASFNFTQPVFATTQTMIDEQPDTVAAAVRAIVNVQKAMKRDVSLATEVGRKSFPEAETALIAQVVERDLPFYDASITPDFVTGMNAFCRDMGLMTSDPAFEDIVATEFSNLW